MLPYILSVEDDLNDAYMLQYTLKKSGVPHQLNSVVNGVEAIEYLQGAGRFADRKTNPVPAVILLDINMPVKNGFETLTWIRQSPAYRQVTVIMLTSSQEARDIKMAKSLGADFFISKTVFFKELIELLKDLPAIKVPAFAGAVISPIERKSF